MVDDQSRKNLKVSNMQPKILKRNSWSDVNCWEVVLEHSSNETIWLNGLASTTTTWKYVVQRMLFWKMDLFSTTSLFSTTNCVSKSNQITNLFGSTVSLKATKKFVAAVMEVRNTLVSQRSANSARLNDWHLNQTRSVPPANKGNVNCREVVLEHSYQEQFQPLYNHHKWTTWLKIVVTRIAKKYKIQNFPTRNGNTSWSNECCFGNPDQTFQTLHNQDRNVHYKWNCFQPPDHQTAFVRPKSNQTTNYVQSYRPENLLQLPWKCEIL